MFDLFISVAFNFFKNHFKNGKRELHTEMLLSLLHMTIIRDHERERQCASTPQKRTACSSTPKGPVSLLTPYVPRHLNVPLYAEIMKITNSLVPNVRARAPRTSAVHVEISALTHARSGLIGNYRALCQRRDTGGGKQAVMRNTFSVAISKLLVHFPK